MTAQQRAATNIATFYTPGSNLSCNKPLLVHVPGFFVKQSEPLGTPMLINRDQDETLSCLWLPLQNVI